MYKKEDIPDEFHYKFNRRIQPIVIVAAEGYNLCDDNHQPCKETGTITIVYLSLKTNAKAVKHVQRLYGMAILYFKT